MIRRVKLTAAFQEFFRNERSGAITLIFCAVVSLIVANSRYGTGYLAFWSSYLGPLSIEHWVNDGLMAVFFLLIGLELKRELLSGELSSLKNALLPMFAAAGGIAAPAIIHFALNNGLPTQSGVGIPMATDIAFAIGVVALISDRVPASLKVFLVAFAVMDDLGAIIVIAVFYTTTISLIYLLGAIFVAALLFILSRYSSVQSLIPFLLGGGVMWFLMLRSGIHPTIAGVLLAFTIPFTRVRDDIRGPSQYLEHLLHKPVAFLILPAFALANTGLVIGADWTSALLSANSIGILAGLSLGKPLGVALLVFLSVGLGICKLPYDLTKKHVIGAGLLGGIGFTMSIFITNLAFAGRPETINSSKMAVFLASVASGVAGLVWLGIIGRSKDPESDRDSMEFDDPDDPDALPSS